MSATTIIVNDETPRRQYTATGGQTNFDFPFPVFEAGDVTVYLTPVGQTADDAADLLTITTDYTITGANTQNSCLVILNTGATAGDIVTIERVVDVARTSDYQVAGDLLAETLNREQDVFIMIAQQIRSEIDRAFKLPATDTSGASLTLPGPIANYVLGWDSAGTSLTNVQELGSYRGTDTTTTTVSYFERDLVKSTTAGQLDNVYICIQDAPAGTLLTNTSYFALIVDGVSAATSAANAATSESNASTSASNAATSEANAATSESNAATSASNASTSASNASTSETNAAASAATATAAAANLPNATTAGATKYIQSNATANGWDYFTPAQVLSDIGAVSLAGDETISGSKRGTVTADNDLSFDMNASNNFKCTPTGIGTLTFTNITAGQSGNIWLDNSGGHAISAAATTYISSADLTTISTAGVYFMSYYADGTNVLVSVSRALTSAGA